MSKLLGKFPNKLPENFIKKTPLEFPKAWILKEKIEEFLKQNCQIPYGFLATITSEILFRRSSSNCFEHFSGNTCPKASCSLPKISFFFLKNRQVFLLKLRENFFPSYFFKSFCGNLFRIFMETPKTIPLKIPTLNFCLSMSLEILMTFFFNFFKNNNLKLITFLKCSLQATLFRKFFGQ